MARAKREHDGFLAAYTAAVVVAHLPFTAAALNPQQLNPFREVDPALEAEREKVLRFIAGMKLEAWGKAHAQPEG
jgi:hypothetical protein